MTSSEEEPPFVERPTDLAPRTRCRTLDRRGHADRSITFIASPRRYWGTGADKGSICTPSAGGGEGATPSQTASTAHPLPTLAPLTMSVANQLEHLAADLLAVRLQALSLVDDGTLMFAVGMQRQRWAHVATGNASVVGCGCPQQPVLHKHLRGRQKRPLMILKVRLAIVHASWSAIELWWVVLRRYHGGAVDRARR